MDIRRGVRYGTTGIVPSRSTSKKNKTTKISTQALQKEESTDVSEQRQSLDLRNHEASRFLYGSTPTRT